MSGPPAGTWARTWALVGDADRDEGPLVVVWDCVFFDVQSHARTDLANEVAGFLLGTTFDAPNDDAGGRPVVVVEASLPALHVETGSAHVEFSHDTWMAFHAQREAEYSHLRILGWYHTHPDIGIFLSGHDTFIHENFFKEDDRVALVLDPVQGNAAFFKRVDGVLDPYRGFGFTELSNAEAPSIEPGSNLGLADQVPAERSPIPAAALPAPTGPRALGLPAPGIAELVSLARRVLRRYWNEPLALHVRRLVLEAFGRAGPAEPSAEPEGTAMVARDRGALLRELEAAEAQLAEEARIRADAQVQENAAVSGLARLKRETAQGAQAFADAFALRLAWSMVWAGLATALVAALLIAPLPPMSGAADDTLRWTISGALAVGAAISVAAATATGLGPLSRGLAERLAGRIAQRIERSLVRRLRLR